MSSASEGVGRKGAQGQCGFGGGLEGETGGREAARPRIVLLAAL